MSTPVLFSDLHVRSLAWTLVSFLWQGVLLACAAGLLMRVARSAHVRYIIGVVGLLAMLFAPLGTYLFHVRQNETAIRTVLNAPEAPASPLGQVTGLLIAEHVSQSPLLGFGRPRRETSSRSPLEKGSIGLHRTGGHGADASPKHLSGGYAHVDKRANSNDANLGGLISPPLIVAFWLAGVSLLTVRLMGGWWLACRLARRAFAPADDRVQAIAAGVAQRLQLRRGVAIADSATVAVPTVVGWIKPVVLMPAAGLSGLSLAQIEAILAHELSHVRRHDYLVNLLQSAIETLLFYQPAVWWLSKRVRAEREHCCDDLAVAVCGDRVAYATALAELAALDAAPRLALAATDGSLLSRVARLLGQSTHDRQTPPASVAIVLGAVVVVLSSAPTFLSAWPARLVRQPATATVVDAQSGARTAPRFGTLESRLPAVPSASRDIDVPTVSGDHAAAESVATGVAWRATIQEEIRPSSVGAASRPSGRDARRPPTISDAPVRSPSSRIPAEPLSPHAPRVVAVIGAAQVPPLPPSTPAAPATPATPSAPSAPSAPTAPGPVDEARADRGHFSWSNGPERLHVEWTGHFTLADDDRDIVWIEDGARVSIVEGRLFTTRVDLLGSQGQIERRYYRNGFERPYESEGRLWLGSTLSRLVEQSGLFAEQRVTRLLAKGGTDAVLSAIDRLPVANSYARRRYHEELLRQTPHTAELISQIIPRVGRGSFGDYDRARVLTSVAQSPAITDGHRLQIAAASRSIGGDYEQRRVLMAAMPEQPAEPVTQAILAAAADLSGNYERGTLLAEVAHRGGVTTQTADIYLASVGQLGSAYEQRRALTGLARRQSVDESVALRALQLAKGIASEHDRRQIIGVFLEHRSAIGSNLAAAALAAAATLRSSHERSLVILDVIGRGGLTAENATALFDVANGLGSYEHRRVLEAAIDGTLSEPLLMPLMGNAANIDSEYERAAVLIRIAEKHELSSAQRALYIDVADAMRSEHDQSRALAALVKAERRRTR